MRRDSRIDSWRGFSLVVIATSHTPFAWRSILPDSFGFTGVAQIFLFLSGLVGGLVYARLAERATDREIWVKSLRRVRLIWLSHAATCALLVVSMNLGRGLGSGHVPLGGELIFTRPGLAFVLGALGVYLPAFTDILPMYCVFALAMPVVVLGILRGRGPIVLGVAVLVWLTAQFGLEDRFVDWLGTKVVIRLPFFRFTGWQIVFVGGLALGVAWARGKLDRVRVGPGLALACLAGHMVLFLIKHHVWPDDAFARTIHALARGGPHGIVLIVDFVLVLGLASYLARVLPGIFTWRWLALLGRHSLAVFGFHLAVMYTIALLEIGPPVLQIGVTVLAIASLTIPAWVAETWRANQKRRRPAP